MSPAARSGTAPRRPAGKGKYASADEALAGLRSGSHVFVGSGCAEPELLVDALVRRAPDLYDVEVLHLLTAGAAPYTESKFEGKFRHNAFFIGPNVRNAVHRGNADYTPCFLSEIPSFMRSGRIPVDAALIMVSPPDAHGFVSLGIAVDVIRAAAESARLVVAQVNPFMPRTCGDTFLSVKDIDVLVEGAAPLKELRAEPMGDQEREIGRYVALLVEDGATLQLGIGAIPDGVLSSLTDKRDLGVHTEMFSDGLLPLIKRGCVTNRLKGLHPGLVVASFCMGSRALYDYVKENPLFLFRGSDYVNDPWVIAQNEKMTAVNSALQVDLTGQVCADSIGSSFYSGVGGQVDFIRGAARSKGGKSIIALPSTAHKGAVSRIVPILDPGAGVVTSRADVDFVVTEYGIAHLKARTIRERALALIQIAHPRFRAQLLEEAKRLTYVYHDQVPIPKDEKPYPVEYETTARLKGGLEALVRPLKASDERYLRDFFYSHSEETVYLRYGIPLKHLSRQQIQEFVTLDYERSMALGAFIREGTATRMVGVVRYYLNPDTRMAEMAVTIHDKLQGRGLGTFMLKHLVQIARAKGVAGFTALVLAENTPMLRLFHKIGPNVTSRLDNGCYLLECRFEEGP